jgi:hypothetical protein
MCQERFKDWYETHQTAFCLMEGCTGRIDRSNDRKIRRKLPVNENEESSTSVTSICLSVDSLKLKTDRMWNKPLHTKSAVRNKHDKKVMIKYCYIVLGIIITFNTLSTLLFNAYGKLKEKFKSSRLS